MTAPAGSVVLRRARIYPLAPGRPPDQSVEALSVHHGRVVAVGSEAEAVAAVPDGTPNVDMGGRVVVPGFTDAHVHWAGFALARRTMVLTPEMSLSEVVHAVAQECAQKPAGAWVVGRGWDHSRWGRWPRAADLDPVSPDHPVALTRKDGHVLVANSLALRAARIGPGTPAPGGGEIQRRDGVPTGLLKETAADLVGRVVPQPDAFERQSALVESWPEAWRRGITGCHDMGYGTGLALFQDLATLRDAGELGLRMVWYLPRAALDEAVALGLRSGLGDQWLTVGGVKLFLDGTLGSRTAHLLAPYEGDGAERGLATMAPEELGEVVARATQARMAVAVHAIGDAAVKTALDAFEAAPRPRIPESFPRHRIEHAQLVDSADAPRFSALGVAASMQPVHAVADAPLADRAWGARSRRAYPWRRLVDAGATLLFGSDAPVETPDVSAGLAAATTRGGWHTHQCVTVGEALVAYTSAPAAVAGNDDVVGALVPPRRADLVVLSVDPFEAVPEDLADMAIEATMIDGVWVWQQPGSDLPGPRG